MSTTEEVEVSGEEVFRKAEAPYGVPVISFPSFAGDSQIYMAQGHLPANRYVRATWNWLIRKNALLFLDDRDPSLFLEWGYARYYRAEDQIGDGGLETFRIDLTQGGAEEGDLVTFVEI